MDALALLCNLHGDGPATLAGLRELGVRELIDLEELDEEALAGILGGAAPASERFLREARLLHERLAGPLIEPASGPASAPSRHEAPTPVATPEPASEPAKDLVPRPPGADRTPLPPETSPAGDQDPVVQAVLGLWNHLDRPEPAVVSPGCTLAESDLDALRPDEVVLLAQAGIRTLDELAACDPLAISGQVEIPYTHLSHLRFLAKKRLREGGGAQPHVGSLEPLGQPVPTPESAQEEPAEDPGGPFA